MAVANDQFSDVFGDGRSTHPDNEPGWRGTEPGWWACQYGHLFRWGTEDWHREFSQEWALTREGFAPYGAPMHCPCDHPDTPENRDRGLVGDPCLDSNILAGPLQRP